MALFNPVGQTGTVGANPRGVWSAGTYNRGDIVRRITASYMCLTNGTTTDPAADQVNWFPLSQDGTNAVTSKSFVRLGSNKVSTTAAGTLAITVPVGGHTVGNLLVIPVVIGNSGAAGTAPVTITGVADNHTSTTNVYTVETNSGVVTVTNQYRLQLCWCILTTGLVSGDVITVTLSGSTQTDLIADSAEFTNVAARDVAALANTSTGTTFSTGSMTPSFAGELLIAVWSANNPTNLNGGQVQVNTLTAAGALTRAFMWTYALLPTNASINPTMTLPSSVSSTGTAMLFR